MNPEPYYAHLATDEKLAALIQQIVPRTIVQKDNIFVHLCASIMSQQLNTKVADVINKRFLQLFGDTAPKPELVLAVDDTTLRSIGLSNAKVNYVKNVAAYFIEHNATDALIRTMDDEEVISFLTKIKGVGRWTAEMILMFALARPDVFAVDDLGIQQGMAKLYNLDVTNKKQLRIDMQAIAAAWSPYRTYACLYLWDYKDKK